MEKRPPGFISRLFGSDKPCVIRSVGGKYGLHLWIAAGVFALLFLGYGLAVRFF